jgi:hypothetical protein
MNVSISINRLQRISESELVDRIQSFKEIDEADIVTAFRDDHGTFTVESTVIILEQPTGLSATPITKSAKCRRSVVLTIAEFYPERTSPCSSIILSMVTQTQIYSCHSSLPAAQGWGAG